MSEIKVSLKQVEDLLEQGKDRNEIRTALGLTHSQLAALFQHSSLKHRKPKRTASVVLVDDSGNEIPSTPEEETTVETSPSTEEIAQAEEKTEASSVVEEVPVVTEVVEDAVVTEVEAVAEAETKSDVDDWGSSDASGL